MSSRGAETEVRRRGGPVMTGSVSDPPTTPARLAAAERRLRVSLQHSVNPPLRFELSASETEALRGRSLEEAIDVVLERAGDRAADAIRATLSDPAALIEVGQAPADPRARVDAFLEREEVELGISRAMRGGGGTGCWSGGVME